MSNLNSAKGLEAFDLWISLRTDDGHEAIRISDLETAGIIFQ